MLPVGVATMTPSPQPAGEHITVDGAAIADSPEPDTRVKTTSLNAVVVPKSSHDKAAPAMRIPWRGSTW